MPVNPTSPLYTLEDHGGYGELAAKQAPYNRAKLDRGFGKLMVRLGNWLVPTGQKLVDDKTKFTESEGKPSNYVSQVYDKSMLASDPSIVPDTSAGSGAGSGYSGSSPVTYSDWSPAAKMFGMDQATAYSEHLANTAHQREVADLKAAGLNPVLGLGSGASTVSGSVSSSSGAGYASSAKKSPVQSIADVIGSIAGVIVTASSKNVSRGASVASATAKAVSSVGTLIEDLI